MLVVVLWWELEGNEELRRSRAGNRMTRLRWAVLIAGCRAELVRLVT